MEKRIGSVLIVINEKEHVAELNGILSQHGDIIAGRMGISVGFAANVISLIVCGNTDRISSLTGKIGRLKGLEVKSVLSKHIEGGENNAITEH